MPEANLGWGPENSMAGEVSRQLAPMGAASVGLEDRSRPDVVVEPEQSRVAEAPREDAPPRPHFWRDSLRRRMLATADVMAVATATLALASTTAEAVWSLALLPAWVVLAKLFGLYDRDQMVIRHLTFDELPRIAAWAAAGTAGLGALLYVVPVPPFTVAHATVIWFAVMTVAAFLRGGTRWLWRRITEPERTCVVGTGELANAARRKIELFDDMHLKLVEVGEALPHRGENGDAKALVRLVDRIIVATEQIDTDWIGQLAAACRSHGVKLSVVSPLRGRAGAVPRLSEVADLPVLEYDTRGVSRSTMLIKRVFDVLGASLLLILTAPLLPIIALAIKLDSRGPLFFVQTRAGLGGIPFRVYKFRTMKNGADRMLEDLIQLDDLPEPVFKFQRDPRVTRVGRILRRLSLDELPQLANVLKGDMSIVGPRPEQIELVRRYRPEHRFRLAVKPGMTGSMQVFGRGALTFSERLAVELDYVENLSLSRDIRILFQTLPAIFRGTGAY
jgi:exopolysaccharide biosynthesis polyprenyl glycosylphosphotransferase